MEQYPFPDRENSRKILKNDYVYGKIERSVENEIFETAWKTGEEEARKFKIAEGEKALDFKQILVRQGIRFEEKNEDYISGNNRYFCEYFSGEKRIKIYRNAVIKWCEKNGFTYTDGLNVILSHEFYHYLEWNRIGLTSRQYMVPILKLGKLKLGKTGVAALSEIAANAFANECFLSLKIVHGTGEENSNVIQERN